MAKDKLIEVQLAKPERHFIKVYKDFFECHGLTAKEKLVYIALKSFLDYKSDSGAVYPSIKTLCDNVGLSNKTVTEAIKNLEKKGAIKKQRRALTKTNLYTLNDNLEMWKAETPEQMKKVSESQIELTTEEMLEELERRGDIRIINAKEPVPTTDQSNDTSPAKANTNAITVDYTTNKRGVQVERYSEADIKALYDYDVLVERRPDRKAEYDLVFNVLYDTLNTTKPTIRVMREEKPTMVVISRLTKLYYEHIDYVLEKYSEQTDRIKDPNAYLLTMLYKAGEQLHFDIANRVNYDMAHWNDMSDGSS